MKNFYQKIEIDAQIDKLNYQKLKLAEYEVNNLISKEIFGDFFLSQIEKYMIDKQNIKLMILVLNYKIQNLNLINFLSEQEYNKDVGAAKY